MDRNLQKKDFWWIIFLTVVSTLTESQFIYSKETPGVTLTHMPGRPEANSQPGDVKQQQQQQQGARARPVVVTCLPDSMEVLVLADMFDTGLQVEARHLHLGLESGSKGGECGAFPSGETRFTLRTHLLDCGTKLSSTEEKIIYSNALVYSPEPSSDGLLRLDGATIPVECHYQKRYAVDGGSLQPTWVPFVSIDSADGQIDFSLLLMTDDWQFERGSHSYFLGDPIHVQVSAIIRHHIPLRVYVDHCVSTATPDAEATLRYDFIEHDGCLADAYLTNSRTHFLPRVEEHKLRFQLDAFRFYQEPGNEIYITCYVKAVPVTLAVNSQNRACSFIENRWRSVDGNDEACRSCDVSQRVEEPPSTEPPMTINTQVWSPVTQQETLVQSKPEQHQPANYYRVRPGMHQSRHNNPHRSSGGLMKRGAEQTVQLGPITVVSTSEIDSRPTDAKPSQSNKTT